MKEDKYELADGLQSPSVNEIENIQERSDDILEYEKHFQVAPSGYHHMMRYDVKPHVKDIKGLKILIDIVDSLHSHKEVKIIQGQLQKMLKYPGKYECWPKAEIDNIFIGPSGGDWSDKKDDRGYGAIKPVFRVIKDLMFKQNSECSELASGGEW